MLLPVVEDCDTVQAPQWIIKGGGGNLLIPFFRVEPAVVIIPSKNFII